MDAIFGLWRFDGSQVGEATLRGMAAAFESVPSRQRALALQCEGPIGFGRVSVGRSISEQPTTREGGTICVADARLYRAPETTDPVALSTSERERLLCRLHDRHGDDAPNRIEGDFAYTLWNPAQQQLTLVRDHVGVRPLFYAHIPGKLFAWASFPDMLVGSHLIPDDFDVDAAIAGFVRNLSDHERTHIRGLKRLPSAHLMRVSNASLDKKRYWSLKAEAPITDISRFEECAAKMRQLLDEAVRRRLPRTETIGAHLSGGLDSTAISVLAARALGQEGRPLHTYSFVAELRPDVRFVDERPYVDATVQGEPNIYSTKITPPPRDDANRSAYVDRFGGFSGAEEKVLTAANRDAVDVILSGWGGDEVVTFNGRGAYAEHFMQGRWRTLWREVKARSELYRISGKSVFVGEVLSFVLPDRLFDTLRRAAGKDVDVMAHQRLRRFLAPSVWQSKTTGISLGAHARRNQLNLFNNGHIAYRLENWAMQGSQHGVQYAFPLLDKALLEYAIRLPAAFFIRDGVRRAIFREAMKGILPESVRTRRPKFAPFPCALLRASEDKREAFEVLETLPQDDRLAGTFDFEAVV